MLKFPQTLSIKRSAPSSGLVPSFPLRTLPVSPSELMFPTYFIFQSVFTLYSFLGLSVNIVVFFPERFWRVLLLVYFSEYHTNHQVMLSKIYWFWEYTSKAIYESMNPMIIVCGYIIYLISLVVSPLLSSHHAVYWCPRQVSCAVSPGWPICEVSPKSVSLFPLSLAHTRH